MGVTYSGISSGSALLAGRKQSLGTEVHHSEEIFDQQPFEVEKLIIMCLLPYIKNERD